MLLVVVVLAVVHEGPQRPRFGVAEVVPEVVPLRLSKEVSIVDLLMVGCVGEGDGRVIQ